MKKIYFLALALFAFTFVNAQIIDDSMEFYTLGEMGTQNPGTWSSWTNDGGASNDGFVVVDTQSNSGDQSIVAVADEGRDPMLLLGNLTSGDYTLRWEFYIPTGKEGYFNIQGEVPAVGTALSGVWNSGDIYFNEGGSNPGAVSDTNGDMSMLSFPHDEWFTCILYVDIDNLTYRLSMGGNSTADIAFQGSGDSTLGGINFYPGSTGLSEMYVDDAYFVQGALSTTDFEEAAVTVYPNPVKDILNISTTTVVDSVVVYDVLGKVVLQAQPDAVSPSIDMSALSSGAYMVQVTTERGAKTVKVVK
ncbi:T9SS type A sorting domain-containing protein [Aureitalea sp. L0-47]|uniref:T9SS type A sorting domain-containing protein n=1 Tax=Aureitalea sp. L0-47 TaxID=2816962 RepID=UPI002238BB72|nr:T9SS type A sorting domain-containing protein [Aureitalea sp. L0-47]MCW5519255.1 T9SS type A sorting domain-containing protein [Aureitalea sp. L0-47]